MQNRFNDGVEFFNTGKFFDAHEAWEDVWRETAEPERLWMQALVQSAVALHHESVGNCVGAKSVLARAATNLKDCPSPFLGLDINQFRIDLDNGLRELAAGSKVTRIRIQPSLAGHVPPDQP